MAGDLDAKLDHLYDLPPEQFVAARDALAKELTGEDRKVVKALRRPSVVAALANRLAREEPGRVQELLAVGERLRDAQLGGSGDVREALAAERASVDVLVQAARGLGGTDPTVDRLRTLLRGTAGDDGLRAALARGRLEREPAAGGAWPAVDLGDAAPAAPPKRAARPKTRKRRAGPAARKQAAAPAGDTADATAAQDARRRKEREDQQEQEATREQARLLREARARRRERATATTRAEKDAARAQARLKRATAARARAREALAVAEHEEAQALEAAQRALRALKATQAQLQEAEDDVRAIGGAPPSSS